MFAYTMEWVPCNTIFPLYLAAAGEMCSVPASSSGDGSLLGISLGWDSCFNHSSTMLALGRAATGNFKLGAFLQIIVCLTIATYDISKSLKVCEH